MWQLSGQYERWFARASRRCQELPPVPVGWDGADTVEILAIEGQLIGELEFSNGPGWTTDWMTSWDSTDESICWDLQVERAGQYVAKLNYACPKDCVGAELELSVSGGHRIRAVVDQAFDTGLLLRPERTKDAKRWMREFTTLELGRIELPAGPVRLTLRATSLPGDTVCELRAVVLERHAHSPAGRG